MVNTFAPYALSIDTGGDQFAVCGAPPRLSWLLPLGVDPRMHEIEAVVDGADPVTAAVDGSAHRFVDWPWSLPGSSSRVRWRVRALGAEGASDWSAWAEFEVGLLERDWTALWISPAEHDEPEAAGTGRPAHELSVGFTLDAEVTGARLYATALGVYEAFVNGERVGSAELSPGNTSYDRTVYAQASDVTAALREGANMLSILLSDGWYRGEVGAFRQPAGWGDTLAARAELHLALADGTRRVIASDENWVSSPSPIVRASLMDGQTTDLTAKIQDAAPVRVDAVAAPAISWSPAPPVRRIESRGPLASTQLADDTWVLDFGQNASGWVRLTDLGPAGTRTVLRFGEYVDAAGDLDTHHLDGFRPETTFTFVQRDEVVSDGSDAVFEPRHTVHGFRYVRVQRDGAGFDPATALMQIVHTDLASAATFACSDDDLTRLWNVAQWSFRGNAVDVPTDCPTRERLGWAGDYGIFISTATRLYDVLGFSRKWLQSVRDDQSPDGRIANFSPDGRRVKHHLDGEFAMMTGSAGWGDAIIDVPWQLYRAYGDEAALAENWSAMTAWVDFALRTAASARHPSRVERSAEPLPHEQYLWDGSFHWGEWAEPKKRDADGTVQRTDLVAWFMADKGEIGTAYLYRSTATLAAIAGVLGRHDDADRYREIAAHVSDAWRTEFLRADGRTRDDTQASYVRALSFGLVPDTLRAAAAARLVERVHEAGDHLSTGFLATGDLLPVLTDAGFADVAYDVLRQRTSPSWLRMLDRGATTIWEDWDGIDDEGHAHDSLNHYSKGTVIRFLHSHTLGLRPHPDAIAWERFIVAPVLHPSLSWARGSQLTPQGPIDIAWRRAGDTVTLTVEVPAGAEASLILPDGFTCDVGPGRHKITGVASNTA